MAWWQLLWIVPVSASFGAVMMGVIVGGSRYDDLAKLEPNKYLH